MAMMMKFNFEQTILSGKTVFRCKQCGRTYKIVGSQIEAHAKTHEENTMTDQPPTKYNNPLTEAEFHRIKARLRNGESREAMMKATGRSHPILAAIRATDTFEAYTKRRRQDNGYEEKPTTDQATRAKDMKMEELIAYLREGRKNLFRGQILPSRDYEIIKEMLFRGESTSSINEIGGRNIGTLKKVRESKDYAEYRRGKHQSYSQRPQNQSRKSTPPSNEPVHYYRLREFRQGLDKVLIEFIKAEVEIGSRELQARVVALERDNKSLEDANTQLKKQNETLATHIKMLREGVPLPDFTQSLKNSLKQKEAHGSV